MKEENGAKAVMLSAPHCHSEPKAKESRFLTTWRPRLPLQRGGKDKDDNRSVQGEHTLQEPDVVLLEESISRWSERVW